LLIAPLGDGPVPCPSDMMIRRDTIMAVGGSEPRFRGAYEDVALFGKIFLREPVIPTTRCWTNYRVHPESCMAQAVRNGTYQSTRLLFLNWFEEYLSRNGFAGTEAWTRLQDKLAPFRHALSTMAMSADTSPRLLAATPNPVPVDSSTTTISWTTGGLPVGQVWVSQDGGHETLFGTGATGSQDAGWINAGTLYEFRLYGDDVRSNLLETIKVSRLVSADVGGESFGSLRRVVPVSRAFGFDRGQPIDRCYIDKFMARCADDVRGRVLEIGEATYTRRFGGAHVSVSDVLHVAAGNPEATIIADLSDGAGLPSSAFDCILLIQTLQLIYDVRSAIQTLYRILKPGGVLLATFPGLSQKSHDEWRDSWYWGFTSLSARRLFAEQFPHDGLTIETHGNVLVASAFLYGLAASELTAAELNYRDESYEALITVRAVKPFDARRS
jgi:SAM-dependent methyltransferase